MRFNPILHGCPKSWAIDRLHHKGGSSSSSSATTTTTNTDRRQVVDAGGIGIASDSSTVSVTNNTLDAGAIQGAGDIVKQALNAIVINDATNGDGFTQLLNAGGDGFTQLVNTGGDGFKQLLNTGGDGFKQLLTLADKMFTGAGDIIGKAQDTSLTQIGQISDAATSVQNDKVGAVNQKTLVILAAAGVGMMALRKR